MRTPGKSVALLLPLLLTACVHKNDQAKNPPLAPPIIDIPPTTPPPSPIELPPPVVTVPPTQAPQITPPPQPETKPAKKPAHHPKSEKTPDRSTDQAANTGTSAVSAIGQLSPGDSSNLRDQTVESIASTERGLKDINRTLSDQEQKTVTQIKEFLKQARTALTSGDVDGAHTLALKAKVLLGEISQ